MKTDDLISLLARDNTRFAPDLRMRLAIGALSGAAISLAILIFYYGIRHDLSALTSNWRVMVKYAVALSFALSAAILSLRLSQPFPPSLRDWLLLLPAPLILAVACIGELAATPPEDWWRRAIGLYTVPCLVSVPLLSAAPLIGIIWALRKGAPASATQAGLGAGGMAAGMGAAIYALHCPDDSPLFLALWYVAATALVMGVALSGGRRFLRW
jgi:hypothetical protein